MRTPITIRQLRDPRKPHSAEAQMSGDHSRCCEYVGATLWTGEFPPQLKRGRTDVQQIR